MTASIPLPILLALFAAALALGIFLRRSPGA
jgi:hypothetical protein